MNLIFMINHFKLKYFKIQSNKLTEVGWIFLECFGAKFLERLLTFPHFALKGENGLKSTRKKVKQ